MPDYCLVLTQTTFTRDAAFPFTHWCHTSARAPGVFSSPWLSQLKCSQMKLKKFSSNDVIRE